MIRMINCEENNSTPSSASEEADLGGEGYSKLLDDGRFEMAALLCSPSPFDVA